MKYAEITDLIRTISAVISAAAIVVAVSQFHLQKKIWQTSHERSRLEKAIEVIRNFNSVLTAESAATNFLVENLDTEQLQKLDNGDPFPIAKKHYDDVRAALPDADLETSEGEIHLTGAQSYKLRFQALEVLNAVEIVCQAWRLDVVDKDMIEAEIEFLYNPDRDKPTTLQRRFRNVFDGESFYPAIYEFARHIDHKRSTKNPEPRPIVPRPGSDEV